MQRIVLRAKIHRATITGLQLEYEGSITVDAGLLESAGIAPGEQVHVLNLNNGARFVTYAIAAPRDSGEVVLNGPAARLGSVGDRIIILAYGIVGEGEIPYQPRIVLVDEHNRAI
ncbi:MAG: aspartate 1-decarboxylase [Verrucomicrobia bacterium]|nr:MAG: aspartate 1-decarboxylase [Verrucomicrobiota bacterium]